MTANKKLLISKTIILAVVPESFVIKPFQFLSIAIHSESPDGYYEYLSCYELNKFGVAFIYCQTILLCLSEKFLECRFYYFDTIESMSAEDH